MLLERSEKGPYSVVGVNGFTNNYDLLSLPLSSLQVPTPKWRHFGSCASSFGMRRARAWTCRCASCARAWAFALVSATNKHTDARTDYNNIGYGAIKPMWNENRMGLVNFNLKPTWLTRHDVLWTSLFINYMIIIRYATNVLDDCLCKTINNLSIIQWKHSKTQRRV